MMNKKLSAKCFTNWISDKNGSCFLGPTRSGRNFCPNHGPLDRSAAEKAISKGTSWTVGPNLDKGFLLSHDISVLVGGFKLLSLWNFQV